MTQTDAPRISETEDGLVERLQAASAAARKAGHHFPADALSEAVTVIESQRGEIERLGRYVCAPALEQYDDMRDGEVGIVTAAGPDAAAFWRLVAGDVDSRSHLYDEPTGAALTAAELLEQRRRLDMDGPTAIELAQMRVEPPEWRWFRRPVDVDHDHAVNAAEGDEGAFYGALIVLKPAAKGTVNDSWAPPAVLLQDGS